MAGCLAVAVSPAGAEIFEIEGKPLKGVKIETVRFRGWLPDQAGPLQGAIVLIPGRHGDGAAEKTRREDGELFDHDVGGTIRRCELPVQPDWR